jgi:tetratricopeptide (TPR) repeat protein
MDKILKSRLIGETQQHAGRSAYEFTDLRIRDALYEEMSLVRRSRYHLKTGQAIEEIYGERMSDAYGVLAFHYLKGNENAKCLTYSLKAAEEAARLYAHKEAIKYYQIALDLLEGSGDRATAAMVLGELGDSYWFSGSSQLCLTSYEKAARLYEELGDKRKAARVYTKMGHRAYDAARDDTATPRRHYDRALALLDGEGDVEELAWLYQNMARFDWLSGNFVESDAFSRKALALAEKLGLHEVEAHTHLDMAVIAPPAEKEKKLQNMQRALQIGLEHGYLEVVLRAYNNLAAEGTAEEGFEYTSKGLEYAKRVGYIGWQANFQSGIGDYYRNIGELQKAEEIGNQLLKSAATRAEGEKWAYPLLGGVYLMKGDLEQSEKYLKLANARVEGTADFQNAIFFEFGLGWVYYEKGDLGTADKYLTKAWNDSVALGLAGVGTYVFAVVQILSALIQIELEEGKVESAKRHLEELKKLISQTSDERASADMSDSVGRVLALEGDFKSSAEELRKALAIWKKHRDVYAVIRTLYELGSVYQRGGDQENASKSFEEVLETSRRIGSTLYVDRTLAKMGRK